MRADVMRLAMPSIGEQLLKHDVRVNTYLVATWGAELDRRGPLQNMVMLRRPFHGAGHRTTASSPG